MVMMMVMGTEKCYGHCIVMWPHWRAAITAISVAISDCRDCKLFRKKSFCIPPPLLHFRFRGIICSFCIGPSLHRFGESMVCSTTSESVNIRSSAGNWLVFLTSKFYEAQPHPRGQEQPFPLLFSKLTMEGGREKVVVFIQELFVLL